MVAASTTPTRPILEAGTGYRMGNWMQLAQMWREHLAAGCPRELAGVEFAGTDARLLDKEITACVSALLTQRLTVDDRIEHRLEEVQNALDRASREAGEPVAGYAQRLNRLVSAVLTESRSARA
jgi:hypothetical protein